MMPAAVPKKKSKADKAAEKKKKADKPAEEEAVTSSRTGPTMTQFEQMREEIEELRAALARKRKREEDDDDAGANDIILSHPGLSKKAKYTLIEEAVPLSTPGQFKNVLNDPDGPKILEVILNMELQQAVREEGLSYDTNADSSALASKVIHKIFSIEYIKNFKVFDPRENYTQAVGTAMAEETYKWLKNAMVPIVHDFYQEINAVSQVYVPNNFKWDVFFAKFRHVWRWTRSNNSDKRKLRRRKKE